MNIIWDINITFTLGFICLEKRVKVNLIKAKDKLPSLNEVSYTLFAYQPYHCTNPIFIDNIVYRL